MRYYLPITFCLALLLPAAAQAQSLPVDYYHDDAVQLVARLVADDNTTDELPATLIDSVEFILWRVQSCDHPKAKIVAEKYAIHARQSCNTHSFSFIVDGKVSWAQRLIDQQTDLSRTPLQEIVAAYKGTGIRLISHAGGLFHFAFYSERNMNMSFFSRQISMLRDIDMVFLGTSVQSSPTDFYPYDIRLRRISAGWIVSFHYRESPYADGDYHWQFGVPDKGKVRFLGEYGEVMPPDYELTTQEPPTATYRSE